MKRDPRIISAMFACIIGLLLAGHIHVLVFLWSVIGVVIWIDGLKLFGYRKHNIKKWHYVACFGLGVLFYRLTINYFKNHN